MPNVDRLAAPYSTILCDIWGVIHDGGRLLPGAADRLQQWQGQGKRIILVTNAPRPASTVRAGLDRVGLPRSSYDGITSSGEAGIAALVEADRPVGFLGTEEDRRDLEAAGVRFGADFTDVACTGFDEERGQLQDYAGELAAWVARGVVMHCLNPDREVIHFGRREPCAGALADHYEALGGQVVWYGKPHAAIYRHALALAGHPPREAVLAIGDGLLTDMLGAARAGVDALFVSHGLHGGKPFPADFSAYHGLGEWRPLATVRDLA
jgi:HAD superfamily hydrolase (TIGR01459 family)